MDFLMKLKPYFVLKNLPVIVGRRNILKSSLCESYSSQFQRYLVTHSSSYSSYNSFTWRSHTCGELNLSDVGRNVTLCGWLQYKRTDKFAIIRDGYGRTQIILDANLISKLSPMIEDAPLESVIQVTGMVQQRPSGHENKKMLTGDIEIVVNDLSILNKSIPNLPIHPRDYVKVNEQNRLKFRYIDLRNDFLQNNLRLRSSFVMKLREFLCNQHGFVDVETPTLFRRTPGGAQEFIVPTQSPGLFFSLTQSPQQFKQLLMVGGMDRYFQIARCYRDEGQRPDRQPEFTQVDIEMSFVTAEGIMSLIEQMLTACWPNHFPRISYPFKRMTYSEAMDNYGCDKPDTTFEMLLLEAPELFKDNLMGDFVKVLVVPSFNKICTRRLQEQFHAAAKESSVNLKIIKINSDNKWTSTRNLNFDEHFQSVASKALHLKSDDVLVLGYGSKQKVLTYLGKLRLELMKLLAENDVIISNRDAQNLLWITDFPLFIQNSDGKLESAHHPFTAAHPDDLGLLYSDPEKVRGLHYDLVLNGAEIGGGSIRIHQANVQKYVLHDILKEDTSELLHLISALESGCPPHGGIALGLDRLIAILCKAPSIRDVIAFPKAVDGKDLMGSAPAPISSADRNLYHLK
ncbi:hypothetical protein CHUAL_010000 [Chamberlinius hualienensis]